MNKPGAAGRTAAAFLESLLTPLLVAAALLLGLLAVALTPREEEPQIVVPMMDVWVRLPGATAAEVESRVTIPMESKIAEIPGVEYLYAVSRPGVSLVTVRFYVGEDLEDSLVKLYDKLMSNADLIPPGASPPLVKPKSIDDVPVTALTFWGEGYDADTLRRIVQEAALRVQRLPGVAQVEILGGAPRTARILLSPQALAGHGLTALEIVDALRGVNAELVAGTVDRADRSLRVEIGSPLREPADLGRVVVGLNHGRPVHLQDVARIVDGPAEAEDYVLFAPGPAAAAKGIPAEQRFRRFPAVTLDVAKKKGTNAVKVSRAVAAAVRGLRGTLIPGDVHVTVTRDYGATALEKSNELIKHLVLATVSVTLLIGVALGVREALVVAVAVPVTLALTLFFSMLFGYTLNRVTLFALIFAIGILVDDAIVVVENIHRHFARNPGDLRGAAVAATDEVGNPTILATLTVIAALLPMVFISGLMGPYMEPIPINASVAMLVSLAVAFTVTPWLTLRLARRAAAPGAGGAEGAAGRLPRLYGRILAPLIERPLLRRAFLGGVVLLLAGSLLLPLTKAVRVKMLPFDNKSEFQVIVDMPEGTSLERTANVCLELGHVLDGVPEVTDYQIYAGTHAPVNFNGLVRHYFLRRGAEMADIQVNLVDKHRRRASSHEIARRVRPLLGDVARRYRARIKVAEVPPGPPVLATLVAEVYGPEGSTRRALARRVLALFDRTPGVVDADWYEEEPRPTIRLAVDPEKAALAGIPPERITRLLRLAIRGTDAGLLHVENEREPVPLRVRLERPARSSVQDLRSLPVAGPSGLVPLAELVRVEETVSEPARYRKNQRPVVYVTGDMAGREESPIYGILAMRRALAGLAPQGHGPLPVSYTSLPDGRDYAVKWDGEWQITYEVFRDMGIAFAGVLVLIYILIVGWFRSFAVPVIIMAPIPLTLVGILPGHWIAGSFFTATSMIGFIALAGIIVRNSILLVDFIEMRLDQGAPLERAVIEAGAVRLRPIVLTAAALIVGAVVILLDPIFQGLAVSLISGIFASTLLTLVVIPVLYYAYKARRAGTSTLTGGRGSDI